MLVYTEQPQSGCPSLASASGEFELPENVKLGAGILVSCWGEGG